MSLSDLVVRQAKATGKDTGPHFRGGAFPFSELLSRAYIPLKVHVHGRGQITKSFAVLHEVTVPRPREMIGQYWNSVFSEERQHFEPRLDRLLGIRVIEKFHAWILDQQHGMMRDVAYEEERLTIRLHVEHGVPERVAWRRDCRDAWQKLLLILEKYQSIPNRQ